MSDPVLSMNTELTHFVHFDDLAEFIEDVLGVSCIPYNAMVGRDYAYDIVPTDPINYELTIWNKFLRDGVMQFDFEVGVILDKLCFDNVLEQGTYVIQC